MINVSYFLISLLIFSIKAYSQEAEQLAPIAENDALKIKENITTGIAGYFDGMGLQYKSSEFYVIPNWPKNQNLERLTTLEYRGQFPYFDLKTEQKDGDGKIINKIKEVAYDGDRLQFLYEDGRLDLHKHKLGFDDSSLALMPTNPTFFAPFWFINPEVVRNLYHVDQVWNLKKLIDSNKSFADLTILGREMVDGTPCIVIALKRGDEYINHFQKAPSSWGAFPNDYEIRAFLSEVADYYPVKWQLLTKNRGVLLEYQVEKLGSFKNASGITRYYPAKGTLTDWGSRLPVNSIKPFIWRSEIESVNVVPIQGTASDYTIDPGLANLIYDEDKHIGINVTN